MPSRFAALLLSAMVSTHAAALSGDQARSLAGTCLTCHGAVRGKPTFGPRLEGMDATRLADRLRAYRNGEGGSLVMRQLARGYTDVEVQALAQWFASQPVR